MIVAVVALVAALAGTAYAASKITGKDIKKNSVNANRISNGTLTAKQVKKNALGGKQIKEGQLKGVRSARRATIAANAETVNGLKIRTFIYEADDGSTDETVLDFGTLTLRASCEAGIDNGLTVEAASASNGATISYSSISQGGVTGGSGDSNNRATNNGWSSLPAGEYRELYSPSGHTRTTNGPGNVGYAVGQIVYTVPAVGEVISVDWRWSNGIDGRDCSWSGTAVGGPDSHEVIHGAPADDVGSTTSEHERAVESR